jgi:hypothetical protein
MTENPFTPRWSTPQYVIDGMSTLTAAVAALTAADFDVDYAIASLPIVDDYRTGDLEYPALAAQTVRAAVREIEHVRDRLRGTVVELNRVAIELETGKDAEDMPDDE